MTERLLTFCMREYAIPDNLVRTPELSDRAFIDFCMREYAIPDNLVRTPVLSDRAFIDFLYERIRDTRQFG